jgi:hypothetical protein
MIRSKIVADFRLLAKVNVTMAAGVIATVVFLWLI